MSSSNDNSNNENKNNDNSIIKGALINCPTITLRDGMKHPIIGFGTYKVGYIPPSASSAVVVAAAATTTSTTTTTTTTEQQRTAEECVLDALQIGYRFFECAEFYGNEQQVGNAISKSGIPRKELFLCSKVWTTTIEQGSDAIRQRLMKTLNDLQTNYIDLYLIHWPVPYHHVNAYKTLIQLRNEGYIKGIGVSNYAYEDYMELKNDSSILPDDLPLVNQIEINPFLYRKNTITKFTNDGVVLQSYRSLRDGKAMDNELLIKISNQYKKTPAQILGRWCIQHNFIYMPKSIQSNRMIENANVFDFIINETDMNLLDTSLTTQGALQTYYELYKKCVNRDTTKDGTMDGVKMNITID